MQELLMNALLAHTTRRAYVLFPMALVSLSTLPASFVFDNFTWDRDAVNYSMFNGKFIPARIPLSAIVSGALQVSIVLPTHAKHIYTGPVIGAPFPPGDPAPRAVSQEYFKKVCPQSTIIDSMEINEHLRLDDNVPALEIFQKWVQKLNSIDDPCVEIALDSPQLFEIWQVTYAWPLKFSTFLTPSIGYLVPDAYFQCGPFCPSRLSSQNFRGLRLFFMRLRRTLICLCQKLLGGSFYFHT